jgi:hypothetical protein
MKLLGHVNTKWSVAPHHPDQVSRNSPIDLNGTSSPATWLSAAMRACVSRTARVTSASSSAICKSTVRGTPSARARFVILPHVGLAPPRSIRPRYVGCTSAACARSSIERFRSQRRRRTAWRSAFVGTFRPQSSRARPSAEQIGTHGHAPHPPGPHRRLRASPPRPLALSGRDRAPTPLASTTADGHHEGPATRQHAAHAPGHYAETASGLTSWCHAPGRRKWCGGNAMRCPDAKLPRKEIKQFR